MSDQNTSEDTMTAYAMAHLPFAQPHDEVFEYIERIQGTMAPFGGRFLVHGTMPEVIEGEFTDSIVMLEFPDRDAFHAWYASDAYQEILPMRTRHLPGPLVLCEGVPENYDARKTAAAMRAALDA